jgi:hypothetical protein
VKFELEIKEKVRVGVMASLYLLVKDSVAPVETSPQAAQHQCIMLRRSIIITGL